MLTHLTSLEITRQDVPSRQLVSLRVSTRIFQIKVLRECIPPPRSNTSNIVQKKKSFEISLEPDGDPDHYGNVIICSMFHIHHFLNISFIFCKQTNVAPTHNLRGLNLGLRTSTRASVYEAVLACTRVHFKNSVTREVLYYRPHIQMLV